MEIPEAKLQPKIGIINSPTVRVVNSSRLRENNITTRFVDGLLSERGPSFDRATGRIITEIRSSISKNDIHVIWVLSSSGDKTAVISYLFHKWLFESLTTKEKLVFFDIPAVLRNPMIYSALRASALGYSRKAIRKSLKALSLLLFGRVPPTYESWIGYRGTFELSIEKTERQVRRKQVPKYTGWRRHQNDQGSIAPQREEPFPLIPIDENDNVSLFLEKVKEVQNGQSTIFINDIRIQL